MKNKVLYFEGAGCVPRGEVSNCRIRTAFHLNNGQPVYLEIIGTEVTKHSGDTVKMYGPYAGIVQSCFEIHAADACEDENAHTIQRGISFRYTYADILRFVNSLGASFDRVEVLDSGYRVFDSDGGYRYGDLVKPIKLYEHTDGPHTYMRLRTASGRIEEIDVYHDAPGGIKYHTSADNNPDFPKPEAREEIIRAFNELF